MSKNGLQRRLDLLTRRACEAEAEVVNLRIENQELSELLMRYESTLSQYRIAVRKLKEKQNA